MEVKLFVVEGRGAFFFFLPVSPYLNINNKIRLGLKIKLYDSFKMAT
jgi:hypothetical protein